MNTEPIKIETYKKYFIDYYYCDFNSFMREIKNLKNYDNNKLLKLQKRKGENKKYSK